MKFAIQIVKYMSVPGRVNPIPFGGRLIIIGALFSPNIVSKWDREC